VAAAGGRASSHLSGADHRLLSHQVPQPSHQSAISWRARHRSINADHWLSPQLPAQVACFCKRSAGPAVRVCTNTKCLPCCRSPWVPPWVRRQHVRTAPHHPSPRGSHPDAIILPTCQICPVPQGPAHSSHLLPFVTVPLAGAVRCRAVASGGGRWVAGWLGGLAASFPIARHNCICKPRLTALPSGSTSSRAWHFITHLAGGAGLACSDGRSRCNKLRDVPRLQAGEAAGRSSRLQSWQAIHSRVARSGAWRGHQRLADQSAPGFVAAIGGEALQGHPRHKQSTTQVSARARVTEEHRLAARPVTWGGRRPTIAPRVGAWPSLALAGSAVRQLGRSSTPRHARWLHEGAAGEAGRVAVWQSRLGLSAGWGRRLQASPAHS